jgi:Lrp/AsnC family transcriptional regulator
MSEIKLDEYDKLIIKYYQEDSSISNIELSKKIGLAPSSCLLRVRSLKESKILKQFTMVVDEKILVF